MKILLVDQERYENVRIENSKQYIMKIENEKKKKMVRSRSLYLKHNFNKSIEWNEIYAEKSQTKTSTNTQKEENVVKFC